MLRSKRPNNKTKKSCSLFCCLFGNNQNQADLQEPLLDQVDLITVILNGNSDQISNEASNNFDNFWCKMQTKGESGKTPLRLAAEQGDQNVLDAILQSGIKVSLLKQALNDFKEHINIQKRRQYLTNSPDIPLPKYPNDIYYRISYVNLKFENFNTKDCSYEEGKRHYWQLKQNNCEPMSPIQSQFLEFFEKNASEDLKTDYPEASANIGAAAAP